MLYLPSPPSSRGSLGLFGVTLTACESWCPGVVSAHCAALMLSKSGIFDDDSPSCASVPLEDYIQPTLNYGLLVWWAYYWPTSPISVVLIAPIGVALLMAWQNFFVSAHFVRWANLILPYAVIYTVSLGMTYYVLAKRFRHFRVALLPRGISSTNQPLPRTFSRTVRFWWAFSWRAVFSVIFRFAGGITIDHTRQT